MMKKIFAILGGGLLSLTSVSAFSGDKSLCMGNRGEQKIPIYGQQSPKSLSTKKVVSQFFTHLQNSLKNQQFLTKVDLDKLVSKNIKYTVNHKVIASNRAEFDNMANQLIKKATLISISQPVKITASGNVALVEYEAELKNEKGEPHVDRITSIIYVTTGKIDAWNSFAVHRD